MNKWINYFMTVAKDTAQLSKDPNTKVGAVLVKNRRIKSTGFNGAPQSFPDELVPQVSGDKLIEQKNTFMCHAELNAVLNYDGKVSDLSECTLYTTISPCSHCAKMLAEVGIKRVIYLEEYHRSEETDAAKYIFKVCGVDYISYDSINKEEKEGNYSITHYAKA